MENKIQTETQTETQPEIKTTNCEVIGEEQCETTNTVTCLNCGTEFEGKFCPECGQSAETGRFTMKFVWENILAAFISKDGGIWFTLKNLFTRPGAMNVEILNGKRRRYFSPFPMLIFVLSVYILLASLTGSRDSFRKAEQTYTNTEITKDNESVEQSSDVEQNKEYSERFNQVERMVGKCLKVYNNHYTVIFMLTLPLFLFAARVCYGKSNRKRYYRAEYLVAITYSMVMVVLYRCLVSLIYPISQSFSESMGDFMPLVIAVAFTVCFRKMMGFSIAKTVWRSLLTVALYYFTLGFIALVGIITFAIVYAHKYNLF